MAHVPKILNNEEECSFLLTQINIGKSTLVEQFAEQQYWALDAQGLGRQCPRLGEFL